MAATDALVTRVDFVGVPTTDLERSVAFYGDTLGLRRSVYVRERNYAEFETGNVTLSVYNPKAMGMEHHRNRNPIALHVRDMDAARAKFQEAGIVFNADTLDTGVCFMSFFEDPDGNALMLHHRYAPREPES
jgi:predicted enzyme related to lactoylglutathione lyase